MVSNGTTFAAPCGIGRLVAWVALLCALVASPALAEKRVALVIGQGAYMHGTALPNPPNDKADMVAALKAANFTVIEGLDLDKVKFDRKVRDFSAALDNADVGVFFYAGHGLQVGGINYLMPTDAELSTADALEFEMVRLDTVQRIMERKAKTNILFLDACRNNPLARNLARAFGTRSGDIGRGLAPAESGVGTLISFSTQPGNVALDGTGRNSPFTGPLVKHIATPGDDILTVLTAVRNDVLATTRDKQVPRENHALRAKFYFGGVATPREQPPAAVTAPTAPVGSARAAEAASSWVKAETSTNVAVLEEYIRYYDGTFHGNLARLRLAEVQKAEAKAAAEERQRIAAAEAKRKADEEAARRDPAMAVAPGSGQSFQDKLADGKPCPMCPKLVVAPAGNYTMGSANSEPQRSSDEAQVPVSISKPFAAGQFAVTFDEWDACVADGGCGGYRPEDQGWGRGKHPVINVTWDHAKSYVSWLSRKTGKTYRLLSEAEREYVARAGTTTPFWWGTSITPKQANYDGSVDPYKGGGSKGEYRRRTVPVDSFEANPWGLYNVHGNVWEWGEDCWNETNSGNPGTGAARTSGDCSRRVVRGGSWVSLPRILRSADRNWGATGDRVSDVGFRVGRTLTP